MNRLCWREAFLTGRDTAEVETGHAHGHLDYLKPLAIRPQTSRSAFGDVADWFETLAKAEKSHAGRF